MKKTDKECFSEKMGLGLKGVLGMEEFMVMVNTVGRREESMKDSGEKIKCMEKGLFFGLMEGLIKDSM